MSAGLHSISALRWTTLLLGIGAAWLCWPLWPALVLAAWTASLLRPLMTKLERRMRGRRLPAAILTFVVALVIATPCVLLGVGVVVGARDVIETVLQSPTATSALEEIASGSGGAEPSFTIPRTVNDVLALVQQYGGEAFTLLSSVAGAAAQALLMLVVYFSGTFVFMREGATDWLWIVRHAPLRRMHLERFAAAFEETGRGLLIGVGLTCAAQGGVAMIAYFALGVPQAWVLGPMTGIASVIPVIGSALVWIPIAVGLLLSDHPVKAAILTVVGIGVIGTIDNLLRPVFSRVGSLRMPMLTLFVSAFGGLMVMGAWGAILGPLLVRLLIEALVMERDDDGGPPTPSAT
jgi:predicted PurR-regulated permease PerM